MRGDLQKENGYKKNKTIIRLFILLSRNEFTKCHTMMIVSTLSLIPTREDIKWHHKRRVKQVCEHESDDDLRQRSKISTGGGCALALLLDGLLEGHHGGGQLGHQALVGVRHVAQVQDLVKAAALHKAIEFLNGRTVTRVD